MRRILVLALFLTAVPALAGEIIPGPINARVISVYDGDTITGIIGKGANSVPANDADSTRPAVGNKAKRTETHSVKIFLRLFSRGPI